MSVCTAHCHPKVENLPITEHTKPPCPNLQIYQSPTTQAHLAQTPKSTSSTTRPTSSNPQIYQSPPPRPTSPKPPDLPVTHHPGPPRPNPQIYQLPTIQTYLIQPSNLPVTHHQTHFAQTLKSTRCPHLDPPYPNPITTSHPLPNHIHQSPTTQTHPSNSPTLP